ncbi:hypothetical protein EIP91_009405 [Steccherinum ochraceum]|uniref:Uncharacterized protein n=1 Tax=Steccherinum ochraceum TaxID=92696 RepID=A0A4R0R3Y3_9APHY|nr:hypothetical protein EIP91_009405 [Steccherinum ochraceum]
MRPCIHDRTLHGRINRLLLPLFSNLRTPASDVFREFSQATPAVSKSSASSSPQLSPSSTLPPHAHPSLDDGERHGTLVDYRTMPPPDILLCGRNGYRGRTTTPRALSVGSASRSISRSLSATPQYEDPDDVHMEEEEEEDSDNDQEPMVPAYYRSRPKFGIYCTSTGMQARQRNDHSPPSASH